MKEDKIVATITLRSVIREAIVFGVCIALAVALNAYAIVKYDTQWSELYTDIGYTILLAMIIYGARCVAKIIILSIWWLISKIRQKIKR